MAKKLTVEVDADVSKAKRKVDSLGQTGAGMDGSGPVSPAADRAARSLDQASRSATRLSQEAERGSSSIRGMAKMFGGMAIQAASSYAAANMEKGSPGAHAVSAVGNIAGGAVSGSAFGPWGAVAGGLFGALKSAIDINAEESERRKSISQRQFDFKISEHDYADEKEWASRFKSMTSVKDDYSDLAEKISALKDALAKQKDIEIEQVSKMKTFIANGNDEATNLQQRYLNVGRSRQNQLESAIEHLEDVQKSRQKKGPEFRAGTGGIDALSSLGLGGGGGLARDSLNVQKEMAATLKSIDQKTKTGGASWA